MNVENNALKKSCVAGLYAAGSDAVMKHLGASKSFLGSYLIHNFKPIKAGVAAFLISFTAEKCALIATSRLPKTYQDSSLVHLSTRIFSHLIVGSAFGAGSALLFPAVGITATAGVALGFATLVGTAIDRGVECIVTAEYFNNNKSFYERPASIETFKINLSTSIFYIPFSDLITSYLVSPQSFLGHILFHHVQSLIGNLVLGSLISISAHIAYLMITHNRMEGSYLDSPLMHYSIWITSHLTVGTILIAALSLVHSWRFTPITGIALGIASFVGPVIVRLICKIIRTFYINTGLHTYINNFHRMNEHDFARSSEIIIKEGTASHQASLWLKYQKCVGNPCVLINELSNILKDYDIKKMNKEEFQKWKSENSCFWQTIFEENYSIKLNSMKPTYENFAGIYYALKETDIWLELNKKQNLNAYRSYFYKDAYRYLSNDLKNDQEFNYKALAQIGDDHWEVMNTSMKTEEFVRESALRNNNSLLYCDPVMIKNLLPELIEDDRFILQITEPILLKIAVKVNGTEEEVLIKKIESFFQFINRFEKICHLKVPKPLRKKIIAYSII